MYEPNVAALLARLQPDDLVLDIGGWACPFNRAQWVLDAEPYETRGFYRTFGGNAYQGGEKEWFSADTWVRHDICGRAPFPFPDKHFDFVICSHTLEDIRDPIGVCAEIVRVGKRGYIEVPSRAFESTHGMEQPNLTGLSHHRWLIEIGEKRIDFLQKYGLIHDWRYSLPRSYRKRLSEEGAVQWLWWEGDFAFREVGLHGMAEVEAELSRYVRATCPHPAWKLALDHQRRRASHLARRVRAVAGS
ncbi:MAG: methyltransferase domain-containing protein [Acidobacteriota bacterium]